MSTINDVRLALADISAGVTRANAVLDTLVVGVEGASPSTPEAVIQPVIVWPSDASFQWLTTAGPKLTEVLASMRLWLKTKIGETFAYRDIKALSVGKTTATIQADPWGVTHTILTDNWITVGERNVGVLAILMGVSAGLGANWDNGHTGLAVVGGIGLERFLSSGNVTELNQFAGAVMHELAHVFDWSQQIGHEDSAGSQVTYEWWDYPANDFGPIARQELPSSPFIA